MLCLCSAGMMPINGSLSSGSNSSLDELASDVDQPAQPHDHQAHPARQHQLHRQHHQHQHNQHTQHQHNYNHQHHHHQHNHHHQQHQKKLQVEKVQEHQSETDLSDHNHNQMISPGRIGARQATTAGAGLSRSASRVSRFRSAKEFFERLSSVNNSPQSCGSNLNNSSNSNNNNNHHQQPGGGLQALSPIKNHCKQSPERTRGNVALRYIAPLAANHQTNLSASWTSLLSSPVVTSSPIANSSAIATSSPVVAAASSPLVTSSPIVPVPSSPIVTSSPIGASSPFAVARSPIAPAIAASPVSIPIISSSLSSSSISSPLSSSSSSSSYVRLKTTDTSGLSTNTILHINNSHLSCNARGADSSSKSVIVSCEPPLEFEGDNVIIGTGSLLVRRNKQLRIKFDETTTATFEYPPEEQLSSCSSSSWTDSDTNSAPVENGGSSSNGQEQGVAMAGVAGTAAEGSIRAAATTAAATATEAAKPTTLPDQIHQAQQQQPSAPTSKQTTALNSIDKLANGLSNYKPSSLMMETTNNLDNQLGVKKLVPSHNSTKVNIMTTTTPMNKLRQNHSLDHWSSNNGSVIYAQAATNHHGSNKYLKGTNGTQNSILIESKKVEGSQRYNPIINTISEKNTTQRVTIPYKSVKSKTIDHTNGICGEDLSGEDLKNNKLDSVAKWSNGSGTTSDLLF